VSRVGAVDAPQDTEVIDALRHIWKEITHRQAAFSILLKLPWRFKEIALLCKSDPRKLKGWGFSVISIQHRLGIESVDMRRSSFHEKKDDSLRPGRKVGTRNTLRCEKRLERDLTEAEGGSSEKFTTLEERAQ